jgi:hypothetical protein
MKICDYCKKTYSDDCFGVALTTKIRVYRRRKCKYCYQKTKKQLQRKYRQWLINYKKRQKCNICGIADHRVLDFHHQKENKEFSLGDILKNGYGFEIIKREVKKCTVICANCHRILHYQKNKNQK